MPTYEYKCDNCGHTFEKFQSITAEPIKVCPQCGKEQVRRLIGTGAGMIFKGSGFYITDYRDASYKDKAKADAPASGETAKTAEGGKETKTPAAPAATPAAPATPAPASPAPAKVDAPAPKPS